MLRFLIHLYIVQTIWCKYPNLVDTQGNEIWYREVSVYKHFEDTSRISTAYLEFDTVSAYTKKQALKKVQARWNY